MREKLSGIFSWVNNYWLKSYLFRIYLSFLILKVYVKLHFNYKG
jgi:hypothetical protein